MTQNQKTLAEITAVPVPQATSTYRPIANGTLVEMFAGEISRVYNVDPDNLNMSFGLSKNDQQMFASITVDDIWNEHFKSALTLVFRNSYDKSLSVLSGSGANSAICDNLQTWGDLVLMRKHTVNMFDDLRELVQRSVQAAIHTFNHSMSFARTLEAQVISADDSFRTVGLAMGHGVLKPQQATVALNELKESSHEEFKEENVWSLYNHFTEALKRGPAGGAITRHDRATQFFNQNFLTA